MAAINRPTEATYVVHEQVTVDTADQQDHTFSGIMFPIKCKAILPVDHIVITSVSVRGDLGPLTVWVTKEDQDGFVFLDPSEDPNTNRSRTMRKLEMKKRYWVKIYDRFHPPSRDTYVQLDLSENPIRISPNRICGIYIHSSLDDDTAIVYDRKRDIRRYDDPFLTLFSGRAHVSTEPFGRTPIWGRGNAWRDNREFVGRINFGVVYKLWDTRMFLHFGGAAFQNMVRTIMTCQKRAPECPFSLLPDDCIFYILNMCRWDWAGDSYEQIRQQKRKIMTRFRGHFENPSSSSAGSVVRRETLPLTRTISSSQDGNSTLTTSNHDAKQSDEEDDDDDDDENYDGYEDHSGSSTFFYQVFDDLADDADHEAMVEAARQFQEEQRRLWFRSQFMRGAMRTGHGNPLMRLVQQQNGDEDEEEEDDDDDDDDYDDDEEEEDDDDYEEDDEASDYEDDEENM